MPGSLSRLTAKVTASLRRRRAADTGTATGAASGQLSSPDDHADTGGIDVSYSPRANGTADPGEVVWTWVPYEEDASQGKDRPVLVIGTSGKQLAVIPLSSKDHADRRDADEWVDLGRGMWDSQFRESYAHAERLMLVDPSAIRREGSSVDQAAFNRVILKVGDLHHWAT